MVSVREARSPHVAGGMYLVAGSGGSVRALVDAGIARTLPRLRPAVDCIARVLERCLTDEGLVVRITIERGPATRKARTCA